MSSATPRSLIRTIPDFPKPGIRFRDIMPLLADSAAFHSTMEALADNYVYDLNREPIDKIVGLEARGFIFGAAVAYLMGVGFVPFRKPGKLPGASIGQDYGLEYGLSRLEVNADALLKGERVLIIDDLLATGGTVMAAVALIERMGAKVAGCAFLVELLDLGGRKKIEDSGHAVFSLYGFHEEEE
jgi:adenine phosphoribosyltransferase